MTAITTGIKEMLNKMNPVARMVALGTKIQDIVTDLNTKITASSTDTLTNKTLTDPIITQPHILGGYVAHDYAGAAVAWSLSAAEAKKDFIMPTNANGAVDAIIPTAMNFKVFTIVNGTGQALTVKCPSGTGIVVASTKTAQVYFDGTNMKRLTPDA